MCDDSIKRPLYVQFVMGVNNARPADEPILGFYIETLKRLPPYAQWCIAGIGTAQLTVNEWSIAKGGHRRTGLKDNVRRAVDICRKYDHPAASCAHARDILGLRRIEA
jgi:3-keto-5-aminohexanoate cleavage enzyme